MPKYSYVAVTPDGKRVSGVEQGETPSGVFTALLERELDPVTVTERKGLLQFEITKRRVPKRDLMHFSRQLAVFVRAGIPMLEALDIIAKETTHKLFKTVLADVMESLQAGNSFAVSAAAHPEAFPSFYVGILRSAELTGNLDDVLDQLADYIDRDTEARRKITSALAYPAIVFGLSIVTIVIVTAFVLPRFKTFFNSLNAKLPLPTRMLLAITNFLTSWWWIFAVALLALIIALVVATRSARARALRDRAILKIPVLGDVVRHAILERFCRILSSMVRAGVTLPEAMAVTADVTNNAVYKSGLSEARQRMIQGEGLAGPLGSTGLLPAAARQMIRVGEETGTLDNQLEAAAIYFDRELDFKIKRFTTLFEPAVIMFVGVIVGFVAIALVSAMYGIFHQVKV
jgi:type IV pilus assembly protein PilC